MKHLFHLIANHKPPFRVWAFFASRDDTSPSHQRRDGSYGWPR